MKKLSCFFRASRSQSGPRDPDANRPGGTETDLRKGAIMSRRLVPLTFWTLSLVVMALSLALRVNAAGPPARVPSLMGTWDGFVHDPDGTGAVALVRSVVGQQVHSRFRGDALVLSMDGRIPFNAINFAGTV